MIKNIFLCLFILMCFSFCKSDNDQVSSPSAVDVMLDGRVTEAWDFVIRNGYNQRFCFLLDFSIPSGKNRFFVWDFVERKVVKQYLVTHGTCDGPTYKGAPGRGVQFSNMSDSHCSSIGKYKIGSRDYSGWGIGVKYWLHGLEKTNNNAVKRVIVLHSWGAVPNMEIYPLSIVRSWGCPAVSNDAMTELDEMLKSQPLPTLLWIYV